jgi:hypothetical protein
MWKHCSSVLSNFVVLLVLVALVWAGDPPWSDPRGKDKPYQQWTDEDITRLSADSPWTHPVTIERSWVGVGKQGVAGRAHQRRSSESG